jgi:metallo-beta-lactamase class B
MVKRFILLFLFLPVAIPIVSGQTLAPPPVMDSAWVKPYDPFRVAGNLYWVGTYDLGCYLITTSDGHILINTGLAQSVPAIINNIEKLGFNYNDIKILLTTQAHFDHVAGMAQLLKETGARMMVHQADEQVMKDGGKSDFLFGGSSTFVPVTVDETFRDGDTIRLGNTKLVALHHPGHTKGSTSYMLDVNDEKRSWRVLIVNIPSILPQTRISGMPSYPTVGKDYAYTLEALMKLEFDLWVASHASQFRMHDKRKPNDPYRPEAFRDRPGYEASINSIRREYDRRLKAEKE